MPHVLSRRCHGGVGSEKVAGTGVRGVSSNLRAYYRTLPQGTVCAVCQFGGGPVWSGGEATDKTPSDGNHPRAAIDCMYHELYSSAVL